MPLFRSGFVADHGIRLEQLDGDGNRGGGVMPASAVSENTVINALAILLNPSSYPVLVCCSLGRHNTGSTSRCYIATRHRIRGCLPLYIPARFPFAVVIKLVPHIRVMCCPGCSVGIVPSLCLTQHCSVITRGLGTVYYLMPSCFSLLPATCDLTGALSPSVLLPSFNRLLLISLSGSVVACLRKLQQWNLTSIFEEYRRYAGTKVVSACRVVRQSLPLC